MLELLNRCAINDKVEWKGAYLWSEDHGAIQEDCIVLGDGKVMHHDASRYGDSYTVENAA